MKRARFTDEQIIRVLQEADRSPVAEVAKRHCSPHCQVDSEDVEFSACCLNNLGGNFPSAPWGRSSL